MSKPFLSIIIPVYNEEKRISKSFTHLKRFLKSHKFQTEVVFVDDGSQDNSKLEISSFAKASKSKQNSKIKIVSYKKNQGKGYALKIGVEKASGHWMLFVDADMSIPLSEFEKFLPKLNRKHKILIGVRDEQSRIMAKQGLLRRFLSRAFRTLSNFIVGVDVPDITCGFKCFEGKTAKKLFGNLQTKRWAYDAEVFMLAKAEHVPITPVQIKWEEDKGTRIDVLSAMIGSLKDLVKMRLKNPKF